jgi:hypothetical protein
VSKLVSHLPNFVAETVEPPSTGDLNTEWSFRTNSTDASKNISIPLNDRRSFKNVRIYITELPQTPNTFRDKYYREREQATRRQPAYYSSRPQTYQMIPIPQIPVDPRPETMNFADIGWESQKLGRRLVYLHFLLLSYNIKRWEQAEKSRVLMNLLSR